MLCWSTFLNSVKIGKKDPFAKEAEVKKIASILKLTGFADTGIDKYVFVSFQKNNGTITEGSVGGVSTNLLPTYLNTRHTHVEIHPSLLLGVMGNQIVFPENNQLPRDLFSCGQSKQGVSLFNSNQFDVISGVSTGGLYFLSETLCLQGDLNQDNDVNVQDILILLSSILG